MLKSLKIWNRQDIVLTEQNIDLAKELFYLNQCRFRVKDYFNNCVTLDTSICLQEQKAFNKTHCFIDIKDACDIYESLAKINWIILNYDIVYILKKYESLIKTLIDWHCIEFVEIKPSTTELLLLCEYQPFMITQ